MQMTLIRTASAVVALLVLLLDSGTAKAYPQFQFSTDTKRCDLCHYSPAGGGLIKSYGRDAAGEEISMAGNGDFLHGAWTPPDWLDLGMDYRGATIIKDDELTGSRTAIFPMQFDLYTRAKLADRVSFNMIAGFRGQARTTDNDSVIKRLVSREHFVMWKPRGKSKAYLRVGRFFAPYGLRLPDHTSYIRRYLGFHSLEETYNISYGSVKGDREYHMTAFAPTPDFLGSGTKAFGYAGYYEKRIRDGTAAWGAQVKVAVSPDDVSYMAGGVGKMWLAKAKLLLLGELNAGFQTFDADGADGRPQLAGYLGLTYFPMKGLMLGTAVERYTSDLSIKGTERDSVNLSVQLFPYAHIELMLIGKFEFQGSKFGDAAKLGMFQFHYYL